jgi:FkbM family methyltransferase
MEAHSAGRIGNAGKRAAPFLARGLNTSWLRNPVRLAGTYLDILQGRGSGTGWDMAGEVSAAMAFLKGSANPVIFDVGANHGEWTRGIWQALGTGRYYAYEPQSACQVSLASLQIPSLTIVQSGMSD